MWKTILSNLSISLILVQSSITPAHQPAIAPAQGEMRLSLRAESTPSILFKTQNGRFVEQRPPEAHILPHLVLKRNGRLTPAYERKLVVTVPDFPIPSSGARISLEIETQHGDPDLGGGDDQRILIWQQTIDIPGDRQVLPLDMTIQFDAMTDVQGHSIPTPTDYFRTRITAMDMQGRQIHENTTDYAFLIENQWQAPLPRLDEAAPGAAPRRLRVYYCDMFPFELGTGRPGSRLRRDQVEHFIATDLIPSMVQAVETQTNSWGFPWYPEWTNYRPSEDVKTLSVALTDGETWFHGLAPIRGHAEISIRTSGMSEFVSLADGIMSTFHHELFHNLQRNISLHFGGNNDVGGMDDAWQAISEGTAVLASSVGQPDVQFDRSEGFRPYITRARAFIGSEGGTGGDLNRSYRQISYHAAIYWRFLYEQCGGSKIGLDDPASGMQVIRVLLETLYEAQIVDVGRSTALVESLPELMDRALERSPLCPFHSYAESLEKFSLAIYRLKLEDGRCIRPAVPSGCGFYDPEGLYSLPPVQAARLLYGSQTVRGDVAGGFGMDFIELLLKPATAPQPLELQFDELSGQDARFAIQVLPLKALEDHAGGPVYLLQMGQPLTVEEAADGSYPVYQMDASMLREVDCLAIIITRTDANEASNAGEYQVSLQTK